MDPNCIINDDDYIYIAGDQRVGFSSFWRIEKRRKVGYIDIGLRIYDQNLAEPIKIACEPEASTTSPLRIAKDTNGDLVSEIYGLVLVDPDDSADSGVRIQIQGASGPEIKALARYE